jgi:hypothetical protein
MGQFVARSRLLSMQKAGNVPAEYEDAAARDDARGRFAVADGASDAYDSGRWARLLVDSFVAGELPAMGRAEVDDWVAKLAQRWSDVVPWAEISQPRNWYKYEKARLGDFATFLGLELDSSGTREDERSDTDTAGDRRWRAIAVGDSCLFQIRGNELVPPSPFPLASSADFNVTPPLVATAQAYNRRSLERLRVVDGCYRPGDLFLLATDALACGMIAAWEAGEQPWAELAALPRADFSKLVSRLRRERLLRNDDVTLLIVETKVATRATKEWRRCATSVPATRAYRRVKQPAQRALAAPSLAGAPN